jgi:hypothetical protein
MRACDLDFQYLSHGYHAGHNTDCVSWDVRALFCIATKESGAAIYIYINLTKCGWAGAFKCWNTKGYFTSFFM